MKDELNQLISHLDLILNLSYKVINAEALQIDVQPDLQDLLYQLRRLNLPSVIRKLDAKK